MRSKGREVGIGVGRSEAEGASSRKSCIRKRERESAIAFCTPGICLAEIRKLLLAASNMRLRRRCMRCGQWEVPEVMHWTTAWLLHQSRIRNVDHSDPQTMAAMTMGYSSFHWME